jgi:CheY-like chemotaxis protein
LETASPRPLVAPQAPDQPRTGGRVILLVDDEPIVLRATARLLALEGFEVHQAANDTEAIARAKELASPPDIVLVDLWMSPTTGAELARTMMVEGLASKFIFTSASDDDLSHLPGPLLMKPFSGDQLLELIARATTG